MRYNDHTPRFSKAAAEAAVRKLRNFIYRKGATAQSTLVSLPNAYDVTMVWKYDNVGLEHAVGKHVSTPKRISDFDSVEALAAAVVEALRTGTREDARLYRQTFTSATCRVVVSHWLRTTNSRYIVTVYTDKGAANRNAGKKKRNLSTKKKSR